MNKEIEIPEGYDARIEGNKVILELKESEDERIPRLLHKLLCAELTAGQFEKHGLTVDDALYWLERQKEGNLVDKKYVQEAFNKGMQAGMMQKPAEWGEEDEVYLQDALWCVEQARKVARGENDMGACWSAERWLKSLKNRGNSQKTLSNSSWKPSEEQMCALKYASTYVPDDEGTLAELYEQLKKL